MTWLAIFLSLIFGPMTPQQDLLPLYHGPVQAVCMYGEIRADSLRYQLRIYIQEPGDILLSPDSTHLAIVCPAASDFVGVRLLPALPEPLSRGD